MRCVRRWDTHPAQRISFLGASKSARRAAGEILPGWQAWRATNPVGNPQKACEFHEGLRVWTQFRCMVCGWERLVQRICWYFYSCRSPKRKRTSCGFRPPRRGKSRKAHQTLSRNILNGAVYNGGQCRPYSLTDTMRRNDI